MWFLAAVLFVAVALVGWDTNMFSNNAGTVVGDGGVPSSSTPVVGAGPADGEGRPPASRPPGLVLPAIDHGPLLAEAERLEEGGRFRFATARHVDIRPATHGRWRSLGDGRSRWELDLRSVGATSLNLAFGEFHLPPGASLTLSGRPGGEVYTFTAGDNDAHGQLWTPLVAGDRAGLALEVHDALVPAMGLALAQVNHGFRGFGKAPKAIGDSDSGACNIDVVCSVADDATFGPLVDMYRDQIRAVGAYTLGGTEACSGALINNAANDTTPYFLTADHCGISSANAASVVVYWNFENTTCRQPGSSASGANGDGRIDQFNSGAIFRAGSGASDFTLIELDDPVSAESNPFFAGWDRGGTNPGSAIAIHHPGVSEKRISFELDPTTTTSYGSDPSPGDGTHIRVADWDFGTTEGGSSGSPLFDDAGRIIGQLHGGGAACGNDLPDWYGRLSVSWDGGGAPDSRLSGWLDPAASGVTHIDGINAEELFQVAGGAGAEGDSGTATITLTVTHSPAAEEAVSVRLRTADGTAAAGVDYLALDTVLEFPAGVTERSVDLTVIGDTVPEEHETVSVSLSEASGAIASATPAVVMILNDDYVTPEVTSPLSAVASEGAAFRYQITALGTPTSYEISAAPAGMAVDGLSGEVIWVPSSVGSFTVDITARNPAGADTERLSIEVVPNDLLNALDITSSAVLSNPAPGWARQTENSQDGEDAARSAAIGDSAASSFSLEITGPEAVRFWWSVSSEEGYDFLSVELDGAEQRSISGVVGWEPVLIAIPEGQHTLTWIYTKDGSVSEGADAGWVDLVTFASVTGEPVVTSPTRVVAELGRAFAYTVTSIDPAATFAVAGLPPGLSFDGGAGISGSPSQSGDYTVTLTADNGQSSVATLALSVIEPIGPSVEKPGLRWQAGGDAFWFPQSSMSQVGGDAAQAGDVGDGESSQTSIEITGPDTLAFWWKVSSEESYDHLELLVDGTVVREISGEVDWSQVILPISAGGHTITWRYSKDGSADDGQDTGWLDGVFLASGDPGPLITSLTSAAAVEGQAFAYQIVALNAPTSYGATGLPAWLSVDPGTGLVSGVAPAGVSAAAFELWAENGAGRTTIPFTLDAVILDTAVPPAVEQPALAMSNDAAAPWSVTDAKAVVGGTSAVAGAVGDDGGSALTAYLEGPGELRFDWSVSSEETFDRLAVYVDGVRQQEISGEVDWATVTVMLAPGTHEIRWVYEKDGSASEGQDTGWVDNIRLGGYAGFVTRNGLRFGEALPGGNTDRDPFSNFFEYVFAGDPADPLSPAPPAARVGPVGLEFAFTGPARLDDVSLQLFESGDLAPGSWVDSGIAPGVEPAGEGLSVYRFAVPLPPGGERGFFRIGASPVTPQVP